MFVLDVLKSMTSLEEGSGCGQRSVATFKFPIKDAFGNVGEFFEAALNIRFTTHCIPTRP